VSRALWLAALLGGCGSPPAAQCTASFSGNFTELVSSTQACPKLQKAGASTVLTFDVTAPIAVTRLAVVLDLGANPAPGRYAPQDTTGTWWAASTRDPGCVYSAGATAVPSGAFVLVLDSVDAKAPHGTLSLLQGVHALDTFGCGDGDVERVELDF
jgi:hypothetical protein